MVHTNMNHMEFARSKTNLCNSNDPKCNTVCGASNIPVAVDSSEHVNAMISARLKTSNHLLQNEPFVILIGEKSILASH
jgi:hypothetical protein